MPLKGGRGVNSIEPHVRIHKHPPIRLNNNSKTNNILLLQKGKIIHIYCHENIYSIKKREGRWWMLARIHKWIHSVHPTFIIKSITMEPDKKQTNKNKKGGKKLKDFTVLLTGHCPYLRISDFFHLHFLFSLAFFYNQVHFTAV